MKTTIKTTILFTLALLACSSATPTKPVHAAERPTYALILEDCTLKRTLTGTDVYCTLPASYFVEILNPPQSTEELEETLLLEARYNHLSGYVRANTVEIVSYLPVTAYPTTGKLKVDDERGLNMRKTPTMTGEIISSIADQTELTLIGETQGEERKAGQGTLWYFTQHGDEYGYVYNMDVEVTQPIEPNIIAAIPETPTPLTEPPSLKPAIETIIIIALILPTIFIVLILFRKPKPQSKYAK